jgi:hypothetical protein
MLMCCCLFRAGNCATSVGVSACNHCSKVDKHTVAKLGTLAAVCCIQVVAGRWPRGARKTFQQLVSKAAAVTGTAACLGEGYPAAGAAGQHHPHAPWHTHRIQPAASCAGTHAWISTQEDSGHNEMPNRVCATATTELGWVRACCCCCQHVAATAQLLITIAATCLPPLLLLLYRWPSSIDSVSLGQAAVLRGGRKSCSAACGSQLDTVDITVLQL